MSKGLEALKFISRFTNFQDGYYKDKLDSIEKELKALEIIKKKGIDLYIFKVGEDLTDYNLLCNTDEPFTQEEYDLLREVLL